MGSTNKTEQQTLLQTRHSHPLPAGFLHEVRALVWVGVVEWQLKETQGTLPPQQYSRWPASDASLWHPRGRGQLL